MKKNNSKVLLLTVVATLGLLSGCGKKNEPERTEEPQAISWYDTLPKNEDKYYETVYDAKILETVPVLNKEINEVIGWVWQNDYCHILSSNGTYDYVENVDGVKGYVEHKYLQRMISKPINQFAYLIDDTETYTGAACRLYPKTGQTIEKKPKSLYIRGI
ncbi:MAG: hypothetical protein IKR57_01330 [Bacilli bacterium]|nr:hypothetical protein [Bacilli bacterium]